MFKRLIHSDLLEWQASSARKPLVLRGARQVGKTVAVRMFGETYDLFTELNLERPEDAALFDQRLSPTEILQAIRLRHKIPAPEYEKISKTLSRAISGAGCWNKEKIPSSEYPILPRCQNRQIH